MSKKGTSAVQLRVWTTNLCRGSTNEMLRTSKALKALSTPLASGARHASRWTAEKVPMGPADPILGLNDAFNKVRYFLICGTLRRGQSALRQNQGLKMVHVRRIPSTRRSTSVLVPTVTITASPTSSPPSRRQVNLFHLSATRCGEHGLIQHFVNAGREEAHRAGLERNLPEGVRWYHWYQGVLRCLRQVRLRQRLSCHQGQEGRTMTTAAHSSVVHLLGSLFQSLRQMGEFLDSCFQL
jgi:hypothetical protein